MKYKKSNLIVLIAIAVLIISSSYQAAFAAAALLPEARIVGYYGNFLSTRMGILGEYPPEQMLQRFKEELKNWAKADPDTPVVPAIEYIAIVAQKDPGRDGKYRARMADTEIRKAIVLADEIDGIVILDVQVGLSDLLSEIKYLEPYLSLPNVMLAIDPEFSMPAGSQPGKRIGTVDARDINITINYLAELVNQHDLPPKILVVHRFTKKMVTNHANIKLVPEVQVVMNMDGWGNRAKKIDSYRSYIAAEPVQFTGIKLFYKHDNRDQSSPILSPEQILKFDPVPRFITYQ